RNASSDIAEGRALGNGGGCYAAGDQGASFKEAQLSYVEHFRPRAALQGRIRRLPEELSWDRNRVAGQEGDRTSGVLSNAIGGRASARRGRSAGGYLGRVCRQWCAFGSHPVFAGRASFRQTV